MRILAPGPRWRQNLGYAAGLCAGALLLLLFLLPGNETLRARGPMNTGHEGFRCESCHRPAPGSVRQQLQANARYGLGLRATPADFGRRDVDNEACLACHDRPDDRHPVYRFLEPRFAKARQAIAPQRCESCHREHSGLRVTRGEIGYCQHCHGDTRLEKDPLDVSHERLIADKRWETCLGCHDFHGNHLRRTPERLDQAIAPAIIRGYFDGGATPYGRERRHRARRESELE
jgi:hypothetical protein